MSPTQTAQAQTDVESMTFSWILLHKTYQDPETASALRELFQWCSQDGQSYAPELGYVRVPASVSDKARAALEHVQAGG